MYGKQQQHWPTVPGQCFPKGKVDRLRWNFPVNRYFFLQDGRHLQRSSSILHRHNDANLPLVSACLFNDHF